MGKHDDDASNATEEETRTKSKIKKRSNEVFSSAKLELELRRRLRMRVSKSATLYLSSAIEELLESVWKSTVRAANAGDVRTVTLSHVASGVNTNDDTHKFFHHVVFVNDHAQLPASSKFTLTRDQTKKRLAQQAERKSAQRESAEEELEERESAAA